jgi:hypothetical protein
MDSAKASASGKGAPTDQTRDLNCGASADARLHAEKEPLTSDKSSNMTSNFRPVHLHHIALLHSKSAANFIQQMEGNPQIRQDKLPVLQLRYIFRRKTENQNLCRDIARIPNTMKLHRVVQNRLTLSQNAGPLPGGDAHFTIDDNHQLPKVVTLTHKVIVFSNVCSKGSA